MFEGQRDDPGEQCDGEKSLADRDRELDRGDGQREAPLGEAAGQQIELQVRVALESLRSAASEVDAAREGLMLAENELAAPSTRCIEWAPSVSVNKSAGPEKPS